MTDTKLDLVSDIDMYQFIEKRYEKDKGIVKLIIIIYMEFYDKDKQSKCIVYKIQITYMDGKCLNIFLLVNLSG